MKTKLKKEKKYRQVHKNVWCQVYSSEEKGSFNTGYVKGAINTGAGCSSVIMEFIKSLEYNGDINYSNYKTGRAKNTLQVFQLPGDGRPVVLKRTSGRGCGVSFSRKIEILIKGIHRNYARTAFNGSLALELAGIPTPSPLAWWQSGSGLAKDSYYIYEKVCARETLSQALQRLWREKGESATGEAIALLSCMADLSSKMHQFRIRHGDIVTHNFLVCDKGCELALIDTDHVRPGNFLLPEWMQRFYDLRCLRRLDLSTEGQRFFLAQYLGRELSWQDWILFRFWYLGGFSFRRWFKRFRRLLVGAGRNEPKGVSWWYPY
ncbi:lipopolysaccharide kinase InaA family protein [Desulfonatronovibrio hydrogenovorans]|uniref:lipopolysaccharide kinase InaA family protein n=1 Tax=Desulfonatronovibrio hydrogenovorans TaxID=53245 RepID=UPI0004902625|nr:lipopolysaccharide kinase InaA family protein [Desulfonatronovibrio hydrogenovorans]